MKIYIGFIPLPRAQRDQWRDDQQVAEVNSLEAAQAVLRLFPESKWWRGRAGSRNFTEPAYDLEP